jgi:micrococcal nuclease
MESLMKIMKIVTPLVILLALTACGGGQSDQSAVDTQVAALISQQATAAANAGQPTSAVATSAIEGVQATDDPLITIPEDAACTPDNSPRVAATVTDIWSGDDIQVDINGQSYEVRYIGIDSGDLPVDANRELVEGKQVLLITDTTDVDEYGRLVRYVIADGVFVNLELLRRGAAFLSIEDPDKACEQVFTDAAP